MKVGCGLNKIMSCRFNHDFKAYFERYVVMDVQEKIFKATSRVKRQLCDNKFNFVGKTIEVSLVDSK